MANQTFHLLPPAAASTNIYHAPRSHPHALVWWISTPATKVTLSKETAGPSPRKPSLHPFSRLPLELRLMIWQYAIPNDRVIEIRSWGNPAIRRYAPIKYSVAPHRPPAILHVNQESRREALRNYRLIEVGVSTWLDYDSLTTYIPWTYHPANPSSDRKYTVRDIVTRLPADGSLPLDPTMPYSPQKIYIDYSRDTIYLGPDFNYERLKDFLATTGSYQELPGLQYLALDRKLWLYGRWDYLRSSLYSLCNRPIKEIYIVPDDQKHALEDKFYYRKHEIQLKDPEFKYIFRTFGQSELTKTCVENLGEWFGRLWKGEGREVPKVSWKSIRRAGCRVGEYRKGAWEVQRVLEDMSGWKTWMPDEGA
ncbi:hypothetical protein LHYA1_G003503 [Lachnellula hyalina]|uniref:2EXR domain-containing protein n=1 Tax=Lachnellula hyalina TaxID=1316788 RepID=A0A8H8R6X9_9HELO|nr:uncharacterized protein LHYA1_G003503 [Lachnellula hyalina]TVY27949.1 hypothetical protein LHYA1_G003503 [Lachnellula hyalina]